MAIEISDLKTQQFLGDRQRAKQGTEQFLHSSRKGKTEKLIEYCFKEGCQTLLDIGCNEGYFCNYAEKLGYTNVLGVDYVVYRRRPNNFILADAENLPFKPKSVDVSLLAEVLEHLPNPLRTLRFVRKITKRYVTVSVPGPMAKWGGIQANNPNRMQRIDYRSHLWYIPKRTLKERLNVCRDLSIPARTILMSKEM